jgi:hypothetical protein
MDFIPILIPMADGHSLAKKVLHGIDMQTVDCRVFPITRPMNMQNRRISEAESRNELVKFAVQPFVLMIDCSTEFTSATDVADAVSQLEQRVDYDALAYNTKGYKKEKDLLFDINNRHIDIGCMVVRGDVLQRVTFGQPESMKGSCLCIKFNQDVKIGWVDFRTLNEVPYLKP